MLLLSKHFCLLNFSLRICKLKYIKQYKISREKFEPDPGFEHLDLRISSPPLYHLSYPGSHASSCSNLPLETVATFIYMYIYILFSFLMAVNYRSYGKELKL